MFLSADEKLRRSLEQCLFTTETQRKNSRTRRISERLPLCPNGVLCVSVVNHSASQRESFARTHWRRLARSLALRHELLAFAAQCHVLPRFLSQPLSLVGVEHRFPHDPPDHARPEEVLAVKTLHPLYELSAIQPRINDIGKLMAASIRHRVDRDQIVLLDVVIEFGAGVGMCDRNLYGLVVQA